MGRKRREEKEEIAILKDIDRTEHEILEVDREILKGKHRLTAIKIVHGENNMTGPFTLAVGGKATARVLGFDQNGDPFQIDITKNPVSSWAIDNPAIISSTPETDISVDDLAGLAVGTANLAVVVAGPNGPLTDSVLGTVTPTPLTLTSVKIDISPA